MDPISARHLGILALLMAASLAEAGAGAPPSPPQSRDGLWRMIFARPAVTAPDVPAPSEPIALGRDLFHDTRLSGDGSRSCASCHDPERGFSNGAPRGVGLDGRPLQRNVPGLFNLAWGKAFYWDGRAPTLEAQARSPIVAANEMSGDFATIIARLEADAAIEARFQKAFPERPSVTEASILAALAAYERTLVSPRTRFDRWVAGDDGALPGQEMEGFSIFVGKGGCVACHGGWRFTDDAFHDIGLRSDDPGRGAIPGGVPGLRQFKTPGLRELGSTAPYMHDGSLATLRDVVDHYAGNLERRPSLATNVRRDLALNETEKQALVAFLLTLSSGRRSE
jgi:cytochrome c peroxidase